MVPKIVQSVVYVALREHPAFVQAVLMYKRDLELVRQGMLGNAAQSREMLRAVYQALKRQRLL